MSSWVLNQLAFDQTSRKGARMEVCNLHDRQKHSYDFLHPASALHQITVKTTRLPELSSPKLRMAFSRIIPLLIVSFPVGRLIQETLIFPF